MKRNEIAKPKPGLTRGLGLVLLGLLAACSQISSVPPPNSPDGFLLTVAVNSSSTQEAILQQYSGKVLSWQPQAGFAILKLSQTEVQNLNKNRVSLQEVVVEPNAEVVGPEVEALAAGSWANGANAWGSGANAWGSGANAWGSGANAWGSGANAWGSGNTNIPALPADNRLEFMMTKLPQGHALSHNFGEGVKVAVLDTGMETAHPLFTERLAPANDWKDFVDGDANPQEVSGGNGYGHGTAVAGLIAQVAPKAMLLPVRVLAPDGGGDVATVILGIDWAIQRGAKVINLSLGSKQAVSALQTQIAAATAQGIYVVASVGNSGDNKITYPAGWATSGTNAHFLLSVGSVNTAGQLSQFSSYGPAMEFVAPGEAMQSAYPNQQTIAATGTSFAAPLVSGAVALALTQTPSSSQGLIESYLKASEIPVGSYGLLNVAGLIQQTPNFQPRKALLVVGNTALGSADAAVKNRLESIGYLVTIKDDSVAANSDATGQDLVLISDSASDTELQSKFANVSVPVMVWNSRMFANLKMTGNSQGSDYDKVGGQTQVQMNGLHPLTAGYSGDQTIAATPTWMSWGLPTSSATVAGSVSSNTSRAAIFGYDKNSQMVGISAPARRAGFQFAEGSASQMSAQAGNLFEGAVTWAMAGN